MAGPISLHDLIEGVANAVIEAQDRIERHQIGNISQYFDKDDRPVSVFLKLPNPALEPRGGKEADGTDWKKDVQLRVPLLALVHSNLLKIKDVEISLEVDIGDFAATAPPAAAAPPPERAGTPEAEGAARGWKVVEPQKTLQVDMRSSVVRDRGATASIVLKVEGREPTEGMSRLINQLIKTM